MSDSQKVLQALDKAIVEIRNRRQLDKDRDSVIAAVQEKFVDAITPVLEGLVKSVSESIASGVKSIKIEVPKVEIPPIEIEMPQMEIPVMQMPEIKIPQPIVNVAPPQVNVAPAEVNFPDRMTVDGEVSLSGVDAKAPLPVMMYGTDGKPFMFPMFSGGGGAKTDAITIKNILAALEIKQISGSVDSVNVLQVGGTAVAADSGVTGAGVLRVVHVTDVATSVNISGFTASVQVHLATDDGDSAMDEENDAARVSLVASTPVLAIRQVSDSVDSINVLQLNGTTVATNAGDATAGTLRMIEASSESGTTTSVSVGADASTNVVPTNTSRKSVIITHQSASTLYVATGTATSASSFPVLANQVVGFDDYTGPVNAILTEAGGTTPVRYVEIV